MNDNFHINFLKDKGLSRFIELNKIEPDSTRHKLLVRFLEDMELQRSLESGTQSGNEIFTPEDIKRYAGLGECRSAPQAIIDRESFALFFEGGP